MEIQSLSNVADHLERISNALERIADNLEVMNPNKQPCFTGRNVPIIEIANAIGKDVVYIRDGLQKGI